MRAEEKLRQQIAAANGGSLHFQHEGENVIRWLTGGLEPEVWVTIHQVGSERAARCPKCRQEIGRFTPSYDPNMGDQLGAIRQAGARHHC